MSIKDNFLKLVNNKANKGKRTVVHLGRPTKFDFEFFSRWYEIGNVYSIDVKDLHLYPETSVLVTDQYTVINQKIIEQLPNLKFVCSSTTGHTHLRFNENLSKIKIQSNLK